MNKNHSYRYALKPMHLNKEKKNKEKQKTYHQLHTFQFLWQPSMHLTFPQNGQTQSHVYRLLLQVALQLLWLPHVVEIVPSDILLKCSRVCSSDTVPLPIQRTGREKSKFKITFFICRAIWVRYFIIIIRTPTSLIEFELPNYALLLQIQSKATRFSNKTRLFFMLHTFHVYEYESTLISPEIVFFFDHWWFLLKSEDLTRLNLDVFSQKTYRFFSNKSVFWMEAGSILLLQILTHCQALNSTD